MLRVLLTAWLALASVAAQHNVLIVLADDLGVDYVGCYGEGTSPPPTPNIDALAAQGVLFRNAWAYPSCSPTRAAILTGRHPFRTTVGRWIRHPNNSNPVIGTIRGSEDTLPELLDRAASGYAHACIGKWHMHDVSHGVDAPRTLGGYDTFTGHMAGQLPGYFSWPRVHMGVEQTTTAYATTQQTDDAIAWIQAQSQPWLCYLAYTAPPIPFHAPPASLQTQGVTSSSSNRDKYRAMIEAMDTELGRLLAAIGPTALASTHVLFLGDNGSVQNMAVPPFDPSRAKGSPYEGGLNVPLIYRGPATVQPGREVGALACAVDVFSTALQLCGAGAAVPSWLAVDGVSLVPYLTDPNQSPLRAFAFSEQFTGATWPSPNSNGHAVLRNDQYKLIHRYTGGSHELYDLLNDPWENQNLLASQLTPLQQQNYFALLTRLAELRTPRGRCVSYGTGCAGSGGVPTIGCVGDPEFGSTYDVTLASAAASSVAFLATGLSHTEFLGAALPADLSALGAGPGCRLWQSLEATTAAATDASGAASVSLLIPNATALMEFTMLHGWLVFDPAAPQNPLQLVTSGSLAAVVGL